MGANKVFKSSDRGQTWTVISPDLTENTDREGLSLMGVTAKEFTIAKHDGVQSYGNLVQLSESPRQAGVLYAGADDGSVYMTRDDGKNWTNITAKFPGVPKNSYVSRLTPSTHDPNTVYATFDNHRNDDYGTYVYASADGGNNFRSIGEGIPKGHTITSFVEDPQNPQRGVRRAASSGCSSAAIAAASGSASGAACPPCRSTRSCSTRATTT